MKKIILAFWLLFPFFANSQPWLISTENENYIIEKELFNLFWKNKTIEKGKGWKQFKRTEQFYVDRIDNQGNIAVEKILEAAEINNNKKQNAKDFFAGDWAFVGPSKVPLQSGNYRERGIGRVNCIAFNNDDPSIIYIGAPSGGFWKSSDGGSSWRTTTDFLPNLGISDIAISNQNPNIIYIATGDEDAGDTYSYGVLRSVDAGENWTFAGNTFQAFQGINIGRLLMMPNNNEVLLMATSAGIFRTNNAGNEWFLVQAGNFTDMEFKPDNSQIVFASRRSNNGESGIYRSTNGGQNFTLITQNIDLSEVQRIELAVTENNSAIVYAVCSKINDSGLHSVIKTDNTGDSWTEVFSGNSTNLLGWNIDGSDAGGQGHYDLSIAVSPTNENEIFIGGINIWKSTNGGTAWELNAYWSNSVFYNYIHADHHTLVYSPENVLYNGNDGGIYRTANAGQNWENISNGLEISQIYRMGVSENNKYRIVTGLQDNGTFLKEPYFWQAILGGDGMECMIDRENENIIYATTYYGSLFKSTDGGENFISIKPNNAGNGDWITPFMISPSDNNVLYAAYSAVFRSDNKGYSWTKISPDISLSQKLRTLAVAPSNSQIILCGNAHQIWKTVDGGTNWIELDIGFTTNNITDIEIAFDNPEKIWLSLSHFTEGDKVWYSANGGASWNNISDNLPNVPTNCLIYEKNSPDRIYIGTDVGVFFRQNEMVQWEFFNTNLPNVIVNDFEIHYPTKTLLAATYGRGVWESPLFYDENSEIDAEIISMNNACLNSETEIKANSFGVIDSWEWNFGADAQPQTANNEGVFNVVYSTTGVKTIQLKISANGNEKTFEKQITVSETLNIEVQALTNSVCAGVSIPIVASGAVDYTWSPAETLNSNTGDYVVATPYNSTEYTVIGTLGNCTGEASVFLETTIQENDNICAAATLEYGQYVFYSNKCATVEENEPLPPLDNCTGQMSWCAEGGLQNSVWFKFQPLQSGRAFIATHGFDNQIALYESNSCNDLLSGNFTLLAANDDHLAADYSATIELIENLNPNKTYWLQVDGSAGGAIGNFRIILDDKNLINITEIHNDDIEVFPNPANDVLFISLNNNFSNDTEVTVILYDINGKQIIKQKFDPKSNFSISTKELHNGIFLMQIISNKAYFNKKIVVKH